LIKSLNNNPKVIDVINGESDGSDLTSSEQHILKQIDKFDYRLLRTLIDFYSPTQHEEATFEVATASEISKTESAIQRKEKCPKNNKLLKICLME